MTTPDRIALALAACQGLTDDDLAARGPAGFAKMIDRKRRYAAAARALDAMARLAAARIKSMGQELETVRAQLAALEVLDAPVTDTTQAADMLAAIAAGKGATKPDGDAA